MVAIKSFDAAKCRKHKELACARGLSSQCYGCSSTLRAGRERAFQPEVARRMYEGPLAADGGLGGGGGARALAATAPWYALEARAAALARGGGGAAHDETSGDVAAMEVRMLRSTLKGGHLYIANMIDECVGSAATHAILEYCGGGSLERYLTSLRKKNKGGHDGGGMAEEEAAPCVAQIASGLAHLHGLGIAHRDIKPANLLFSEGRRAIKLCDFGFAIRWARAA